VKRYLLDTCVLLWLVRDPKRLSRAARRILESNSDLLLSPVSAWEILAKADKLKLSRRPSEWIDHYRQELELGWLPLYGEHVLAMEQLPRIHHDPFDRMLVCQAMVEGIPLITPDENLHQYPIAHVW